MAMPKRAPLGEQLKLIGRIELTYWIAGTKHPLTGQNAINILSAALVDVIDDLEPVLPMLNSPVIHRVERIYNRCHAAIENAFQHRWREKRFER